MKWMKRAFSVVRMILTKAISKSYGLVTYATQHLELKD